MYSISFPHLSSIISGKCAAPPQFSLWFLIALDNIHIVVNRAKKTPCICGHIPKEIRISRTRPEMGRTYAQKQKKASFLNSCNVVCNVVCFIFLCHSMPKPKLKPLSVG